MGDSESCAMTFDLCPCAKHPYRCAHLGVDKVPSSWSEKNPAGQIVGREFRIHFLNGKADVDPDGLGEYLITHGFALRSPWQAPAGSPGRH
jgi:hypothetical protein